MDNGIDQKTKRALLEALSMAQDYSRQLQARSEKRLWTETTIPVKLSDTLSRLTKSELDKIRKNLDLKNLSALKKGELADRLEYFITEAFKDTIRIFDKQRYDLTRRMVNNQGFVTAKDITISKVQSLMEYGIAFPGVYENHKIIFMPLELMNIFKEIDEREFERIVKRNTEWIKLTHGLLYYYGVIDVWQIRNMMNRLTGQEIDLKEYMTVLSAASDYYGQMTLTAYGYADDRIFDVKNIADEQMMRADIDYYPFTKQQLLKAGEADYIDRTPAMNNFINFLLTYYDLNKEETDEIMLQVNNMINMDSKPTTIIQYLQSCLEFSSFDMLQQLTAKIMDLYNNTRMWVLKGHTPNELFEKEKKYLRPLPVDPFEVGNNSSNVFDIRTGAKIGRNDPCPCGSNKKYKKCCGK